jgi:hypothetical protein
LDVTTCFLPLIRWVLAWWPPDEHRLALASDAQAVDTGGEMLREWTEE